MDLAETLTQECFLKAHRNWDRFRGDSSAMTWLMRIAINLEKDHWRNRRMQFWRQTRNNSVDLDEASEWLPSGERSAEQQMLAREQVGQVWKAVEGLSERQRTVFLLRYVEDQELSEIAQATGLSEGTVKAHLSRALVKVRAELRRQTMRLENRIRRTRKRAGRRRLEQALKNFRSSVHAWSEAE